MISRVNTSWLLPFERPLVSWLVVKLPAAVKPDHLTITGFAGALTCGLAYSASSLSPHFLWLANAGLIINKFGDSLDGNLARFRNIERPRYGFFIDNTTDVLSEACIFLGLGASPYMLFDTACLALLSFYIVSLFTFIRAVTCQVFQISYHGIGPTEIHFGLLCYNIYLLTIGPWSMKTRFGPMSPIDAFVIIVFIAVLVSFVVMIWSEGRRIAEQEGPSR